LPNTQLQLFREVLRYKNYRNYSAGRLALISAMWMERIAYGWLAWEMTHSELWLGTLAAGEMMISLLVTPVAGALADRMNSIGLLKRCHILSMVWSVALLVTVATGVINIYLLMLLVMAKASSSAFSQPVGMSMVNNLVGGNQKHLGTAISINATVFHLSRIIGPALGGLIISIWGVSAVFAIGFFGYLIFVLTLQFAMDFDPPAVRKSGTNIFSEITAGLRYAVSHPALAPVLLLGVTASFLLRPYFDLLPSIADVMFSGGANGLAILASFSGLGGLVGSVYIMLRQGRRQRLRTTANMAIAAAALLIVFTQTTALWLGAIVIAFMALTDVVMAVGLQILVQTQVDEEYRGRCISLLSMMVRVGPPTGAFVVGLLSTVLPLNFGLALVAVCGLVAITILRLGSARA
jgi:MFS family permease